MTGGEIVALYLDKNGYDGLFIPGECACKKEDLFPCCEGSWLGCEPGYLMPGCPDHDWHIGKKNSDNPCK